MCRSGHTQTSALNFLSVPLLPHARCGGTLGMAERVRAIGATMTEGVSCLVMVARCRTPTSRPHGLRTFDHSVAASDGEPRVLAHLSRGGGRTNVLVGGRQYKRFSQGLRSKDLGEGADPLAEGGALRKVGASVRASACECETLIIEHPRRRRDARSRPAPVQTCCLLVQHTFDFRDP